MASKKESKDDICEYCKKPMSEHKFKKSFIKDIEKRSKEVKEGRTYMMTCKHTSGKYKDFVVCWMCVAAECKRWYRLGLKDGRKKAYDESGAIYGKDAKLFLKRMKERETAPITEKDKKLYEEIMKVKLSNV